jgi:hypothetical protein
MTTQEKIAKIREIYKSILETIDLAINEKFDERVIWKFPYNPNWDYFDIPSFSLSTLQFARDYFISKGFDFPSYGKATTTEEVLKQLQDSYSNSANNDRGNITVKLIDPNKFIFSLGLKVLDEHNNFSTDDLLKKIIKVLENKNNAII